MAKNLEWLARHANPLRDFEGREFCNPGSKEGYRNFFHLLHVPKCMVRGGFIGAVMGAAAGMLSGSDVSESAYLGRGVGLYMDPNQYALRWLMNCLTAKGEKK